MRLHGGRYAVKKGEVKRKEDHKKGMEDRPTNGEDPAIFGTRRRKQTTKKGKSKMKKEIQIKEGPEASHSKGMDQKNSS